MACGMLINLRQLNKAISFYFFFSLSYSFYCNLSSLIMHVSCLSFLSVGEDGQVKIWSRSGMLRSTLVQTGL